MNTHYPEYQQLTPDAISAVWDKAVIVLDTNILLNLYRYSEETRDDILSVMEKLKGRLWMPYQVGLEYFNNRINTFTSIADMHKSFKKKLADGRTNMLNIFNNPDTSRHPHINKEELGKVYDEAVKQVVDYIDKQTDRLHDYSTDDIILNKLLAIYDGRVGEDFTTEELFNIYEEGEIRYAGFLPPGFMDEKEKRGKGLRHLFGDLIIWKEILRYSKENHIDIIFVTEDAKEDWWDKKEGNRTPLKELIREFRKETVGQSILMYQQKGFLKASKQNVKETTTTEIEEVSKEDERISRERTTQILEDLCHSWESHIPAISAVSSYGTANIMRTLNNPLLEIIAEQKRREDALRNPFASTLEMLAHNPVSTPVDAARAAIESFSPASEVIKQMTRGQK